ncbi:sigma factor G inhibitor Gin [Bacillus xiapuensis]|uniref:sigma factor G inhibitor Gin n=1 Tax=Bacillus xiapuensis TaxID=2014075 RepID=UPI000C2339C0|nr:sigma factor G inhibitor Gin [Bacillus xiapuensis]
METLNKTNEIRHCIICEQEKPRGIHIITAFICLECEREIVGTAPEDEAYTRIVKKMRKIRRPSVFS